MDSALPTVIIGYSAAIMRRRTQALWITATVAYLAAWAWVALHLGGW